MRNNPRIEPTSTSRKLSPLIHFRRRVDNVAHPLLRVFLIIFRENHAQMRNNSICAPLPVPSPSFSVLHFSVPIPCRSFPAPISATPAVAVQFLRTCAATLTQRQ
jgi:hypothetical protein